MVLVGIGNEKVFFLLILLMAVELKIVLCFSSLHVILVMSATENHLSWEPSGL